jgi:hypothetical protein
MAPTATDSPLTSILPLTRFTLDGSEGLEQHLARTCEKVREGVVALISPQHLEALLLGGGYGRGEGGVLQTEAGNRPYNDLEFYVSLRGPHWRNERHYGPILHRLAEALTLSAGVELEFKILPLKKLRRAPTSMFYYDLMMGHRWLWGTESLLAGCSHHCDPQRIPPSEATRLLMNRCSGLLFSQEHLQREPFTPDNADFVGRNIAKAQLALGDVLLTVAGQYHWSCRERGERLRDLDSDFPRLAEVQLHHLEGIKFKLHPQRATASHAVLQRQQHTISALALDLWLWLENRRLKYSFSDIRDYGMSRLAKCPETNPWRNCLVNLKTFGPALLCSSAAVRYPRERVLNALAMLLWVPDVSRDPVILRRVQSVLRTTANNFVDLVEAYRCLWRRYN